MLRFYIGRLCLIGISNTGKLFVGYRLSSRTFPDRKINIEGNSAKSHSQRCIIQILFITSFLQLYKNYQSEQ
ncbi:IMP cyclohydrolase [[Eubacterium] cellulosolvens]